MKSAKTRSVSPLAIASPIRYGVAAIILVTVAYVSFSVSPLIRRDVLVLKQVASTDQAQLALLADLQREIQQSRRGFLRALLAANLPEEEKTELEVMHSSDLGVAQTESQITALGAMPPASQAQFHENWQQYLSRRDALLTAASTRGVEQARVLDSTLGRDAFRPVELSIQIAQATFQASSARRLREVSSSLASALREFLFLTFLKIVVLALLIWMDWRRLRLERELLLTTQSLKASEARFRKAYDSAMVGMFIFQLDGSILSVNPEGAHIFGYEPQEMCGRRMGEFMAPECRQDHLRRLKEMPYSPDASFHAERKMIRKDGSTVWVRNSVTLIKPEGEEGHYFSITEEITQQKEVNDRLAYLANFDPVTDLPNRHSFEQQLGAALQATAGTSDCLALFHLEIDSFDFINGTFGHTVADEVLAELGLSLSAFIGKDEIVARLDDHAFAMLVRAAPYDEATLARANELRDLFHRASETGKHRIPLSASIGIAFSSDGTNAGPDQSVTDPASSAETLLKFARAAMLEARSRGGDSIFLADPGLKQRAVQRHQIELALLRGIREDEFRVIFQPQFEVATGKLVRFEALCRWNSRELGPIPPDRFIPIAEQTGLILEIGRRILHDALCQAKTWTDSGRQIGVAVNISPMQFMRPDFTNVIAEVLSQTQFPPALLELEITEGIFIRDLNLAVSRIRELQRLGVSVALDDFGTGYSSLSYLQKMPIDAVKLDRSFISDLTTDQATVSMVKSVLAMAEALNLRVVTEGVETEEQLEILLDLGCAEAQGYLLGRPESADLALKRVLESPLLPLRVPV